MVTFEKIVEINNSLNKIKELKKEFTFFFTKMLVDNLDVTNKLIDKQNKKFLELTTEYGVLDDNGEYVVDISNGVYVEKYQELFSEEFIEKEIGLEMIYTRDLRINPEFEKLRFDIETIELLKPLLKF